MYIQKKSLTWFQNFYLKKRQPSAMTILIPTIKLWYIITYNAYEVYLRTLSVYSKWPSRSEYHYDNFSCGLVVLNTYCSIRLNLYGFFVFLLFIFILWFILLLLNAQMLRWIIFIEKQIIRLIFVSSLVLFKISRN